MQLKPEETKRFLGEGEADDNKKIELSPCPFCGRKGHIMIPTGHHFTFYLVMCGGCQCRTKEFPDMEMAVEAWNCRREEI